jgi:hypothetical protein
MRFIDVPMGCIEADHWYIDAAGGGREGHGRPAGCHSLSGIFRDGTIDAGSRHEEGPVSFTVAAGRERVYQGSVP